VPDEHPETIPPQNIYSDERGRIVSLPPFPATGVLVIESEPGAVRGNHLHQHESHLMYVVSGRMIYLEETERGTVVATEVGAGETVISPRGRAHCTVFPERTVICVLNDVDRTGARYEEEVVRVAPLDQRVDLSHLIGADLPLVRPAVAAHGKA